ncbi:hypothetical protein [Burkholderia cepacia]|uniref:hypothetical protein n=1 Tax=Burkholderia cepacia TaxID=292 RepID=UPI00075D7CA3|nr:hypothetical protein [Burkholderia cepacia]KVW79983.1 hypothetical protein WL00_32120 [Burkholderia cepacia]KVX77268.1 hypothetical protein WL07_02345 [Burkholderia cepacia]
MNANVQSLAFPIGSIPDQVAVSSCDIAELFSAIDEVRELIRSRGPEVSDAVLPRLTAVELLVERIAGL